MSRPRQISSPLRAALLSTALLLSGCASLQAPSSTDPATAALRAYEPAIDLGGRLSVRYEMPHGEEAIHGSFQWQQGPTGARVTLLSPLGQALARIEMEPGRASLQQPNQAPRSAPDVDTLTADALGWPLPVAGLRQWLQGFGHDAHGQAFVATPHTGPIVTRDGWQLHYAAWHDDGNGTLRPRRIDLARHTRQAGEVAIRIVIDTWQPVR